MIDMAWISSLLLCCAALLSIAHAAPSSKQEDKPVPVIVAEVAYDHFEDRAEALGTLKANESVLVTANVTETVSAVYFEDGQRVEQGQVLVEMTSAEEHALLDEARIRVGEAERQYERVKSLVTQRSASESLLDERKRDLDTARALLVAIESRLADRLVKAPFAGVLGLRNISPGALVEPGDLIATLDDDRIMKLDFAVPSLFVTDLKPGLDISAKARAYGEPQLRGRGQRDRQPGGSGDPFHPGAGPDSQPGPHAQARCPDAGETARNPREAPVVPESALLQQGRDHFVVIVGDGRTVERRQIQIGARRPGEVEVVERTGGR